ncbi:MAG: AMP-binding enzyme, partial [Acidimicrobiales bacterium]
IAYVILRGDHDYGNTDDDADLGEILRQHVATEIGPIAKPRTVILVPELPKTRSGKIMRRLLRDVAEGRDLGDTTTLADAGVVDEISRRASTNDEG